jgi:hypothetical protein
MVIILIRRFVKLDKEAEFLESYRAQQPLSNPAFKGETLTRLVDGSSLPAGLPSFALGEPSSVTYLNVARWQSWEAFAEHFADQLASGSFNPEIETVPRQRAVVEVIEDGSK